MSNYERLSPSSRSRPTGGATGALFNAIDTDGDGVIDKGELADFMTGGRTSDNYTSSSYKSSSYLAGDYDVSEFSEAIRKAANYTAESNAIWTKYGTDVRGEGLFYDPHPQIIRKELPAGSHSYEQRIQIRFLQPPPVPAAGPLIVKEVRSQAPPLPPLRIRQEEAPAAPLPPIILRERPPIPPEPIPSETVVKKLPALPPPPRTVIIERVPAPAPPRDIIIERWLPYGTVGERETIVERSEETRDYETPHNVIIQYETANARVARQFQQLGVTPEDPRAYLQRYGREVLDSETLIRQARSAGVVEDISVPVGLTTGGHYHTSELVAGRVTGSAAGYRSGYTEDSGNGYRSVSYKSSSYTSGTGNSSNFGSSGFSRHEAKL